ncbi:hypothetical protein, partial [Dyadobacter sp.]|uniref:hypothetical protein n=1 Tax=Dyadobacter sp. TaxID=1914288 RepID=UPI003F710868
DWADAKVQAASRIRVKSQFLIFFADFCKTVFRSSNIMKDLVDEDLQHLHDSNSQEWESSMIFSARLTGRNIRL